MAANIKIAIIHTHPIQYNAPFFRLLAAKINLKVFYTWKKTQTGYFDKKFGKQIKWDIPLTQGYTHEFIKNISPRPGPNTLIGTINPLLIKKIKDYNPDAILVYGWKNMSHLRTMKYFRGKIPVLFRGDSTLLDKGNSLRDKIRLKILTHIYHHIDYALYVGTENKKYFQALGLDESQLFFVPHAVENERFYDRDGQMQKKANLWKEKLGISDNEIVFLYAGKFEAKKNLFLLIKAFRHIQKTNFRLILVGNGPLEEKLKKQATGDERIVFLPFQNQSRMPVVYRLADVFVLPSAWGETWGLSVNEAMASGRAVIASNKVGCATDLVIPDKNGYIFHYDSAEELSDNMLKFNKEKATALGKHSLEIIKEWSYQQGVENVLKLLNEITS